MRYYHKHTCSCYSCQVLMKLQFSQQIFKNIQISNFMEIHPVGAELVHVDKQM